MSASNHLFSQCCWKCQLSVYLFWVCLSPFHLSKTFYKFRCRNTFAAVGCSE